MPLASQPKAFALMDYLNIMAYDNAGSQHSSMDFAQSALDYWLGSGLPPEKAVPGGAILCPARAISRIRRIVQANPAAAQLDSTSYKER